MPFSAPAQSELQSELDRCRANEPTVSQRGPLSPAERYNLTEKGVMGDDRRTRSNGFRMFLGVKGRCSCVARFVVRDVPGNGRDMNDKVFLWEIGHDWGIGGENNVRKDKEGQDCLWTRKASDRLSIKRVFANKSKLRRSPPSGKVL